MTDLKNHADYKADLVCLEIGARGLITSDNMTRLHSIFKFVGTKARKSIFTDVSKTVLLCSYALWNSRHEPVWEECPYIKI